LRTIWKDNVKNKGLRIKMAIDQPKILLVDDEIKVCELFSRFLSKQGFSVQTASDGKMAMVQAEEYKPDCILLDVRMPYGGLELLTRLKIKLPETIIIMVSAIIEVNQLEDYINKGAYTCIEKPVNFDDLLMQINLALKL
jgi:DNA-binding response OmpR family regulator